MRVKRYDPFNHFDHGAIMSEDDYGSYVLHSDFAALAAENEGLREALAKIITHEIAYDRGDAFAADVARLALSRKAAP